MNTNDTTKWNVSDILKKFTQDQSAKLQEEQMKEELKQSMMAQQAQQLSQFVPGMALQSTEPEFDQYAQEYRQGGIKLDPAKKGTFKAQATRMGMSVQEAARHILSNREKYSTGMVKKANFARNFAKEEGGEMLDEYGRGGYTVRKSNDRKGKTHVVTGPDGTKKYFGDPNMGERGNSKNGKEAFYARHATNLKNNPYFRAYARATWEDGGEMIKRADGNIPSPYKFPGTPIYRDTTALPFANGGFVNPEGWPPSTSKGINISDPDEYAYRKGMYDDSLKLHQLSYNQMVKLNKLKAPLTNISDAGLDDFKLNKKQFVLENVYSPSSEKLKKITPNITEVQRLFPEQNDFYHKKIKPTKSYDSGRSSLNFLYKKPTQPINKSGEEPTDPYAHSKTKVIPKVIGVPPDQNEDPTKKYVGANEEIGYDENGNPTHIIEHIYETNKLTRGLKSEPNKNEIVPLTSRKSSEPSKFDFAYRDQAVYEYDKDTKKFSKDSSRKTPLPYAERYSKGWESNASKDIPESGPRVWVINGKEYYNQEDANAAARQYEQIPSYNFADGGPLNDKTNHGEILNSVYASALGNYYNKGEMLKRADGSYSPRGLWDNIRANAGSGKEPTAAMLEQERNINKYANGGETCPDGSYWDENSQTCVPQVNAEEFFKNWYSKRTLPFDEIGNKTYENVMRKILPMYNPESTLLQTITDNSVPYEFQAMIADQPDVMGELVYNQKTYDPEKILLKESLKDNPTELNKTIVSEESTRIRDPYSNKMLPAEQLILKNAIKTYEEGWGDMKKGPEEEAAYNMYNYITDPKQDNIQSALFEVRQSKNLKPDQVITEQDIENWRKEAEANGALDMNSPNFDDSLYKLFKLSKDSKSMTELFNYIASNTDTKTSNPNVAFARYGGDFGYLPNFF